MTTQAHRRRADQRQAAATCRGRLDPRCKTGRVLCIDKSHQHAALGDRRRRRDRRRAVRRVGTRRPARACSASATRAATTFSTLYDTSMPFAMFFSGGQAVHYSSDFAAVRVRRRVARLRERPRLRRSPGCSTRSRSATRSSCTGPEPLAASRDLRRRRARCGDRSLSVRLSRAAGAGTGRSSSGTLSPSGSTLVLVCLADGVASTDQLAPARASRSATGSEARAVSQRRPARRGRCA